VILATARTEFAGVLSTAIYVYTILIIMHIVVQLLFAAGLRPPYNRATNSILQFLRDTCEPFLAFFRRLIPSFGAIDFSPLLALLTLQIVNRVIVEGLIHG
jgi:YggT family protein